MSSSEHTSNDLERVRSEKSLLSSYQASIDAGELDPDPHQKVVILALQEIYDRLLTSGASSPLSSFSKTSLKDLFFTKTVKTIPPDVNKPYQIASEANTLSK